MPPKRTVDTSSKRSQPKGKAAAPQDDDSDNPFASSDEETRKAPGRQSKKQRTREDAEDDEQVVAGGAREREEGEEEEPEKTIPKELLTRLLHEFFTKDATRISRDANATVGKYFDVFVREAIARTAVERQGGFLEVCSCSSRETDRLFWVETPGGR
jgi:centromere protein X